MEESEEKSRSEIERLKHDREAEASRAASEVYLSIHQICVCVKLICAKTDSEARDR